MMRPPALRRARHNVQNVRRASMLKTLRTLARSVLLGGSVPRTVTPKHAWIAQLGEVRHRARRPCATSAYQVDIKIRWPRLTAKFARFKPFPMHLSCTFAKTARLEPGPKPRVPPYAHLAKQASTAKYAPSVSQESTAMEAPWICQHVYLVRRGTTRTQTAPHLVYSAYPVSSRLLQAVQHARNVKPGSTTEIRLVLRARHVPLQRLQAIALAQRYAYDVPLGVLQKTHSLSARTAMLENTELQMQASLHPARIVLTGLVKDQ